MPISEQANTCNMLVYPTALLLCQQDYHIVGFLRYLNSANFADIEKFKSSNNKYTIPFGKIIRENKIMKKTENQAFMEFKYVP